MEWFALIVWFDGGELDGLQFALPFPSLTICWQAATPIETIYANLGIEASYHCIPVRHGETE